MTVLKPRSRMISVRLSEDEYSALLQVCSTTGARSMSELTRDAMRAILNGSSREDHVANHLEEFRTQIRKLERKVEELSARVGSSELEGES